MLGSFEEFIHFFLLEFNDHNRAHSAKAALQLLTQGLGPISIYTARFWHLHTNTAWNEET